jgi:hypothetical protein
MEKEPRDKAEQQAGLLPEQGEQRRGQSFVFGAMVFDVDKAQDLVGEDLREEEPISVAAWAHFFGFDIPEGQGIALFAPRYLDPDYAMTTDLDDPVLVATLRSGDGKLFPMVIDGTHRIFKAYQQDVETLPCLVLDEEESREIRVDPFVSSLVEWPSYDRSRFPEEPSPPLGGAT